MYGDNEHTITIAVASATAAVLLAGVLVYLREHIIGASVPGVSVNVPVSSWAAALFEAYARRSPAERPHASAVLL